MTLKTTTLSFPFPFPFFFFSRNSIQTPKKSLIAEKCKG